MDYYYLYAELTVAAHVWDCQQLKAWDLGSGKIGESFQLFEITPWHWGSSALGYHPVHPDMQIGTGASCLGL